MKVIDTTKFPLRDHNPKPRFWHLATVIDGIREYMAFWDALEETVYIERFSGYSMVEIENEEYQQVEPFLRERGIFIEPLIPLELYHAYYS